MTAQHDRFKVALVYLDGQSVPDWIPQRLAAAGIDLTIRECQSGDELAKHAGDAELVWLFGGSQVLVGNLDAVPRCWAIVRTGSGTDNVPVDEATRRGIVVANTPEAFSDAVSDHVIALLFAVVRQIATLDRAVRRGDWGATLPGPLSAVRGRTLGLVGFGHVPRELVQKLSGFSMKTLAHDPFVPAEAMQAVGVEPASLETVLSKADFVSLHCPLTAKTRHLIGDSQLRLMKPTAVLINTSRGPVVVEKALVEALTEGRIAAAGLDVFEDEPPSKTNPLFQLENVVLTPHIGGTAANGLELRWNRSIETVIALARRRWPPSCVNRDVKPRQPLIA